MLFRRVEIWDEEKQETLVFLSNLLGFGARRLSRPSTRTAGGVELFFKALKQTLKIKTFVGTSANAVRTKVWTALIAMLVLKYLQLKSTFSWSLSTLAALLRQQLFFYRDLEVAGRSFSGPGRPWPCRCTTMRNSCGFRTMAIRIPETMSIKIAEGDAPPPITIPTRCRSQIATASGMVIDMS